MLQNNKYNIEDRVKKLARYIIDTKSTVRATAKEFGVSKSTVHKDMATRLKTINKPLYIEVRKVLDENKEQRHIRGGIATREKYKNMKKTKI